MTDDFGASWRSRETHAFKIDKYEYYRQVQSLFLWIVRCLPRKLHRQGDSQCRLSSVFFCRQEIVYLIDPIEGMFVQVVIYNFPSRLEITLAMREFPITE